MRVILLSDLHRVGNRGEIVEAKPGYARNYLIPQGIAIQATPANEKWVEQQRSQIEESNAQERDDAGVLAGRLDGYKIEVAKRVGETETLYGSVTATDIVAALEAAGFAVDRRQVDLSGGIKTLGEHKVRIRLHSEVTAVVDLAVIPEE